MFCIQFPASIRWILAGFAGLLALPALARADLPPAGETIEQTLCRLIESAAADEQLPVDFFTRLIWRESSFRPGVTSPAGAQGIAQFMPGTAAEQGLEDPFDPEAAIPASAGYLASLRARFGNLGLAAAAYNAGPTRLSRWLADGGYLPAETEDYVLFITGRSPLDWATEAGRFAETIEAPPTEVGPPAAKSANPVATRPRTADARPAHPDPAKLRTTAWKPDCGSIVAAIRKSSPQIYEGVYAPFGVQLSGNFSKARAIASYQRQLTRFPSLLSGKPTLILGTRAPGRGRRAFYRVRLPAQSLREAGALCRDLQRAGGVCVVLRN